MECILGESEHACLPGLPGHIRAHAIIWSPRHAVRSHSRGQGGKLKASIPNCSILPFGTQGKIARIAHGDEEADVLKQFCLKSTDVKRMTDGQFFMPGELNASCHEGGRLLAKASSMTVPLF